MKLRIHLWLIRALVAVIVMGNGLNGYFAYVAHGEHDGSAHAEHAHVHATLGVHHHGSASINQTETLPCSQEAACQEEPGKAANHIHVSCCVPAAVAPGEAAVAGIATAAVIAVDRGVLSPPGQILYPLFKPPRLSV